MSTTFWGALVGVGEPELIGDFGSQAVAAMEFAKSHGCAEGAEIIVFWDAQIYKFRFDLSAVIEMAEIQTTSWPDYIWDAISDKLSPPNEDVKAAVAEFETVLVTLSERLTAATALDKEVRFLSNTTYKLEQVSPLRLKELPKEV